MNGPSGLPAVQIAPPTHSEYTVWRVDTERTGASSSQQVSAGRGWERETRDGRRGMGARVVGGGCNDLSALRREDHKRRVLPTILSDRATTGRARAVRQLCAHQQPSSVASDVLRICGHRLPACVQPSFKQQCVRCGTDTMRGGGGGRSNGPRTLQGHLWQMAEGSVPLLRGGGREAPGRCPLSGPIHTAQSRWLRCRA